MVAIGGVVSRLMVTDLVVVPPELLAVHWKVVPAVSLLTVTALQPAVEEIDDSGSVAVQLTLTLLVYQPFAPKVPVTTGVTTGGVVSPAPAATV